MPVRENDVHELQHKIRGLLREKNAILLAHNYQTPEVQDVADEILSTGGMMSYVAQSEREIFIIGTEVDLVTRLRRENPDKTIIPLLSDAICENMKLHTLEKVKGALKTGEYQVTVDSEIADKARVAVERMLKVS